MRLRLVSCVAILALATWSLAAVSGSSSHDWPQWRGVHRDGISQEKGLLQTWPPEGPRLVWTARDLGGGYGAPSVSGGRIHGMGFRGGDEVVWALDETTGKELWSTGIAAAKAPSKAPQGKEGSHGTPTVAGGLVFVVGLNGEVAALEASTGKLLWAKSFADEFHGSMMSGWGYSESPLVDGDKVICTPGGPDAAMVALNRLTGDVMWKAKVPEKDKSAYSSVMPADVDGLHVYVQLLQNGLVVVAADDGRFLCRYDRMANKVANITTPVVRGDYVFCSTAYKGGSALIRLVRADDSMKADEVYFLSPKTFQNHHGGVVLVGDYLYGADGQNDGKLTCIDFKTGRIVWHQNRGVGKKSAAVSYADGQLYVRYEDGLMALVAATPKGFRLNGKFELPDKSDLPSWPHPVIANGKLYIRDQDVLLCFDVKKH